MEPMKRIECIISGRVQLVMYRDFVARTASSLGIVGKVWNCEDGTVGVFAEGEEKKLHELIVCLWKGSLLSWVEKVDVVWVNPVQEFSDFRIFYTK